MPIVEQQEHSRYKQDIDDLFSFTSAALSALWTHMQLKNGSVPPGMFQPFFEGFHNLFIQTSKSKHMENEKELQQRIENWLNYAHPISTQRVVDGRILFKLWASALERHGIHTWTE